MKDCRTRGGPKILIKHGHFLVNQKGGQLCSFHGLEWFHRCFERTTWEKADDAKEPLVLIFDGHNSHVSSELLAHPLKNDIHLLMLPGHTSHLLQPLDVG